MKKARFISSLMISIMLVVTMIPMTTFAVEGDGTTDQEQTQVVEPIDQGGSGQDTGDQTGETGGTQDGEQGEGTAGEA